MPFDVVITGQRLMMLKVRLDLRVSYSPLITLLFVNFFV